MKTLLNITAAATLLASASVSAQHQWVETTFWKAPQATSFTVKLKDKEKLAKQCSHFKKLIYNQDGSFRRTVTEADLFHSFRKPIEKIVMNLDAVSWKRIEKQVEVTEANAEGDKIPHYTQKSAVTGLLIEDLTDVKIVANENSYTAMARKLNLDDSAVDFIADDMGQYILTVKGLDAACDLYEGNAHFKGTAPSYIALKDEAFEKVTEFYDSKLLPEISELILTKKEGLTQRAARIGYRTGKIIEAEFPELKEAESEKQLMEVMKTIVNTKTLEPTGFVFKSDDRLHTKLESSSEAKPVAVKLEF